MKQWKIIPGILALLFATPAIAKEARYVSSGNYFKIGNDKYWLKGVKDVKGLGTYGRKTGKGLGGWFVRNGFEANGDLGAINGFDATIATATGENIASAAASGEVDIEAISNLKPVSGEIDGEFTESTEYSVIVMTPGDWENVYAKLVSEYENGDSGLKKRFQDKNFRLIDSVVYATNFRVEQSSSVSGGIEAGGNVPTITLSAKVEGQTQRESTFVLTRKQIIAYSFRRLCWDDGVIVSARIDNPGPSDTSNCEKFD